MTPGMLHSEGGFPCLTVKAWNGRLLLIFIDLCLSAKLKAVKDSGEQCSVELLNACVAARSMAGWFDKVERGGRYLAAAEAEAIYKDGMSYVKAYERLAHASNLSGGSRWRYQPKLHAFVHLCEDMAATRANCRFFHCYRDEDNVGLCKRLCQRVHKGGLCEFRVLTRFLLRLGSWHPGAQ